MEHVNNMAIFFLLKICKVIYCGACGYNSFQWLAACKVHGDKINGKVGNRSSSVAWLKRLFLVLEFRSPMNGYRWIVNVRKNNEGLIDVQSN